MTPSPRGPSLTFVGTATALLHLGGCTRRRRGHDGRLHTVDRRETVELGGRRPLPR